MSRLLLEPLFHLANHPQDIAGHLFVDGAASQDVFRAQQFGQLRQDGGAALRDQLIGGDAERGIGHQARGRIRAAAVQADHQFADIGLHPPLLRGGLLHPAGMARADFDGLDGIAFVLNDHHLHHFSGGRDAFEQFARRESLASQANHDDAREVRIAPDPDQRFGGNLQVLAHLAATDRMTEVYRARNALRDALRLPWPNRKPRE